jgi:hypothetical protein
LDAKLLSLPSKKIIVTNSKEVKTGWSNLLTEAMAPKGLAVLPMMMMEVST